MECKTYIVTALTLMLALTSCTFNPFTTDNQLTGNPVGPIVGGVAGAGSMKLLGAPNGITDLATAGGAALGYYVTTLRFASGGVLQSGGLVYTIGKTVTIEIPTDKLYDVNSSELLPEAYPVLDSVVRVLKRYPNNNIIVSGNTSGFGTTYFEKRLSEKRAQQITAYLWGNGINDFRDQSIVANRKLTYVGYGSFFPIANNLHNESLRSNSRIQITSYPSQKDLELHEHQRIFNNVGNPEDAANKPIPESVDLNHEFPNPPLPEYSSSRTNDYKNAFNEESLPANRISPNTVPNAYHNGLKDESSDWGSYKSVASADQAAAGGMVVKQGGYKGELPG